MKFRNLLSFSCLLGLCVFILFACTPEKPSRVVRIGYMNCNNEQETLARFRPLTAWLSRRLGVEFRTVPVDTQDFEEGFRRGDFDLTHTNSLLYVMLRENYGLELLATEKRGQYGALSAGALIARSDSGIGTLEDIRGKRLVFGPQLAPMGFLAQYDLMLREGIDPELDLGYYGIPAGSFKHEKVVYGVYFGEYDVAAAPLLDLEVMSAEGKIDLKDFNVLAQSPLIPYCTFGASAKLDTELREAIRRELLALTPEDTVEIDGKRLKVLEEAWIDGYAVLADGDYDPIRDMARRTNMPPYQEY